MSGQQLDVKRNAGHSDPDILRAATADRPGPGRLVLSDQEAEPQASRSRSWTSRSGGAQRAVACAGLPADGRAAHSRSRAAVS